MTRKTSLHRTDGALPLPEWNARFKEPWHLDFDKEPVNDEKWSCSVTAAIQAEVQNEQYIKIYTHCVETGLRKAIKIISMADVVKLLKETKKSEKLEMQERNLKPSDSPCPQIIELAAKFAKFSDNECTLPSDLMAAVLKYMILNLKNENCLKKRIAAVKERKLRERIIKEKFIRDLKPYETVQEEKRSFRKVTENILEQEKPINDEPIVGPDLYIMLVDLYDPFVFPELLKINVPFLAFLKILNSCTKSETETINFKKSSLILSIRTNDFERKRLAINTFWETLRKEELLDFEKEMKFKNIAILECNVYYDQQESTLNIFKNIFDELSWMQYSAYRIYRQHQIYLKELYVQRLIQSLEPLDLSTCEVYNKLCDALITGEPLTPSLVLYAIVEQVVVGVPETESIALEYEPQYTNFFPSGSKSTITTDNSSNLLSSLAASCKCKDIQYENACEQLKNFTNNLFFEKEGTEFSDKSSISTESRYGENSIHSSERLSQTASSEFSISESLINEVMSQKKTEKEMRNEKKWKMPSLGFYEDSVFLQTYFCDSRLLDPKSIIERFFKKLELSQIWKKYPELQPEIKAFYNFHFSTLCKNSGESEEKLKLKIFFTYFSFSLISLKQSDLYFREEDKNSELSSNFYKEKAKILKPALKKKKNAEKEEGDEEERSFNNFFVKTFIKRMHLLIPETRTHKMENYQELKTPTAKTEFGSEAELRYLHKTEGQFRMLNLSQIATILTFQPSAYHPEFLKSRHKILSEKNLNHLIPRKMIFSLIDCCEISNLVEHNFFRKKEDLNIIEDYQFYEKLNPSLMVQRLAEAKENFNTVQCLYFPPTDNIIIIMHNDCDDRGMFFSEENATLLTPVSFRVFYNYVHPKIKNWLITENENYMRFISETQKKKKEEEERKDLKYLERLKKEYCEMSKEKKKEFLEAEEGAETELEISEKDLPDLRVKPKPQNSEKISFVATNFVDVRVEISQKNFEFHSTDGTEIHTAIETWLYPPLRLHKLRIKKSKLTLYYHQWLDMDKINSSFTLKTKSDIIFSFYKGDTKETTNFNYYVTISWPTGLLIKPIFCNSSTYIKQSYLKTYRKGWDIEEEHSRCFMKNGQVLIFKENGNYDILCGSGTKYTFKDFGTASKYEIISTTGEVWEVRSNNPGSNKKELIGNNKIFIGVDPKTQETFYRREDGVLFMLWQNGTLVTNHPDGTKITSIPFFEEREITTEWTEQEKLHYEELEAKYRSEISVQEPRSPTILRKISIPKSIEKKNYINEGFVSVSCRYVMEHPKYSTVCFSQDSDIKMKMPEQLSITIQPKGNYEVQKEKNFLKADGNIVQFYTYCDDCEDRSMVTLNINSSEVLCKCVDFFKKAFFVFRNGSILFQKSYEESREDKKEVMKKSDSTFNKCMTKHEKKMASMQRGFVLDRDLNGLEFIHADTLGVYCYHLPEETYFDINTDDPLDTICTFSSPTYTIGYEKWMMDYENVENSLPTNIKKKDLKELKAKKTPKKLFKYPFPRQRTDRQQNEKPKLVTKMPKLVISRTIRCLCPEPASVINEVQRYVEKYQKRAEELYRPYSSSKATNDQWQNPSDVEKRLRKIAITLNQNLQMHPHLGIQYPSTEKDIHYFGHLINSMDGLKNRLQDEDDILPDCKQIPKLLPRSSDLPVINEEIETPHPKGGINLY